MSDSGDGASTGKKGDRAKQPPAQPPWRHSGLTPESAQNSTHRSDQSSTALQKTLDYACGAGADCTPIQQTGTCYNPNTVLAHCSYAANSYYQRKGQQQQACDFAGTATVSASDPSSAGCSYPASSRHKHYSFHPNNHHPKHPRNHHHHPKHPWNYHRNNTQHLQPTHQHRDRRSSGRTGPLRKQHIY
ncbi:hypothetical protein COCNU_06G016360 [Cocos nucifera]|uniref:X8 domain-containing protein n=1 Tax=Cocos nucifera TaxID=13894 RepID=A0A8K0IDG7_COCNU|nr:hypothetical protein COCNU_06G016360 [Cocos nucifera]